MATNQLIPQEDIIDDPVYWVERTTTRPELQIRTQCCGDCPSDSLYAGYVEGLKRQPDCVRLAVSKRWFCHTTPSKACFGNWSAQGFDVVSVSKDK